MTFFSQCPVNESILILCLSLPCNKYFSFIKEICFKSKETINISLFHKQNIKKVKKQCLLFLWYIVCFEDDDIYIQARCFNGLITKPLTIYVGSTVSMLASIYSKTVSSCAACHVDSTKAEFSLWTLCSSTLALRTLAPRSIEQSIS